jgi:hypothetical protein
LKWISAFKIGTLEREGTRYENFKRWKVSKCKEHWIEGQQWTGPKKGENERSILMHPERIDLRTS